MKTSTMKIIFWIVVPLGIASCFLGCGTTPSVGSGSSGIQGVRDMQVLSQWQGNNWGVYVLKDPVTGSTIAVNSEGGIAVLSH
jgi:hypothetical protein